MRGRAPGLPDWVKARYATQRAIGALRDVLVAMDRALAPEPKPPAPAPDRADARQAGPAPERRRPAPDVCRPEDPERLT